MTKMITKYAVYADRFEISKQEGSMMAWDPEEIMDFNVGDIERDPKQIGSYDTLEEAEKCMSELHATTYRFSGVAGPVLVCCVCYIQSEEYDEIDGELQPVDWAFEIESYKAEGIEAC